MQYCKAAAVTQCGICAEIHNKRFNAALMAISRSQMQGGHLTNVSRIDIEALLGKDLDAVDSAEAGGDVEDIPLGSANKELVVDQITISEFSHDSIVVFDNRIHHSLNDSADIVDLDLRQGRALELHPGEHLYFTSQVQSLH
eukprot:m.151407 g.151407  ORF g.151407 m.151407 type:complete len:142 (+) comp16199_c4_seq2:2551-2976(+)